MKRPLLLVLALLVVPQLAFAGTQTYSTPGTYTFTVPNFSTLTVTVNGAGGGGGGPYLHPGGSSYPGQPGGASSIAAWSLYGYGGSGGGTVRYNTYQQEDGNPIAYDQSGSDGAGGTASGGSTNTTGGGGAGGGRWYPLPCGYDYGAGNSCEVHSGAGGSGGQAVATYTVDDLGAPAADSQVSVVVGSGGSVGQYAYPGFPLPTNGSAGSVVITWTENQAPTAPTISGTTTPYVSTSYSYSFTSTDPEGDTLRYVVDWNSDGTADEYVPALGYVSSGTAELAPHSWSTTGSKTFKAKAQDSVGNSSGWTSYAVTVADPAPVVLLTASPSSVSTGQSSTLTWSSSYATSCTGTNFSTGGATSGSTPVSPETTTLYTVTCTGSGGTGNDSKTVAFTCTPSNICSGGNVVNSCTGVIVQSCSYGCGSGACVAPPPPSFNGGPDGLTGHLQARPVLVAIGASSRLYWDLSDVETCSVTGDNGDSWSGVSSGANGKTTSAISHQTVYTLSCTGTDDSSINETETVQVVPVYQEL